MDPGAGHLGIERTLLGGGVVDTPGESPDNNDRMELTDGDNARSERSVQLEWERDFEDAFGKCVDRPIQVGRRAPTEGMVGNRRPAPACEGSPDTVDPNDQAGSFERYRGLDLDLQPSSPTPTVAVEECAVEVSQHPSCPPCSALTGISPGVTPVQPPINAQGGGPSTGVTLSAAAAESPWRVCLPLSDPCCGLCGSRTGTVTGLATHFKICHHTVSVAYVCSLCGRTDADHHPISFAVVV